MNRKQLAILLLCLPLCALAGISTTLLDQDIRACRITIEHDHVEQSEWATVLFRHSQNEAAAACTLLEKDLSKSLERAFGVLLRSDLKPVSSIFIRRLDRYPWIVHWLTEQAESHNGPGEKPGQVTDWLFNSPVFEAYNNAIQPHGYHINSVSCEKLRFDENAALIDALCWLNISATDSPSG